MTTEVRCPELPDIRLVSGVQWAEDYQHENHRPSRFRDPLPIPTWNSLRMGAMQNVTEVCGFIDSRYNLHYITNAHEQPLDNFLMDQVEVRKTIERIAVANDRIIGVFHTHPGGLRTPSVGDLAGWPNRDLGWRYFIATRDDVYEYEYRNQPAHEAT